MTPNLIKTSRRTHCNATRSKNINMYFRKSSFVKTTNKRTCIPRMGCDWPFDMASGVFQITLIIHGSRIKG